MTVAEMFRKVNNYNEIAEVLGGKKMSLQMVYSADGIDFSKIRTLSLKMFKDSIRANFIEEVASVILSANYEYETAKDFTVTLPSGNISEFQITFNILSM